MPDNILYFMGAYSNFDFDKSPFIVVHDKLNGLYMLDFVKKKKTLILGHTNCSLSGDKNKNY